LFTWDANTVHIGSGVRSQSHVGDYYIEVPSPARGLMKNFIVEEGEHWNIFLQNKNIGAFTNGVNSYRVDYNADYEIYFGEHVTQKTDFLPVTIEDNTIVQSKAGNAIYVKNGFHAKPGCDWHAYIASDSCVTVYLGKSTITSNNLNEENTSNKNNFNNDRNNIVLYPNPTSNGFSLKVNNSTIHQFHFYIYNFNGILVHEGDGMVGKKNPLKLNSGMYIVKIKTKESWYTEKLIIE